MVKNTDTKALITSLGRNTKMTTPAFEWFTSLDDDGIKTSRNLKLLSIKDGG